MSNAEPTEYERSLPKRAFDMAQKVSMRMTVHEQVCGQRYKTIMMLLYGIIAVIAAAGTGLIVAMSQVISALWHLTMTVPGG